MKETAVKISVVVPVCNGADMLQSTLESVLNQTHRNMEVLVIDDGSDEDIGHVVNTLQDERLAYHRQPHSNANVARNRGIGLATGAYLAMLDADDLWLPEHLEQCLKTIRETGTDGVYGSLIVRDASSGNERTIRVQGPGEGETMINYLLRTGYGAPSSTLFMTVASAKDIRWDETLLRHQDYDFVVRYSQKYRLTVRREATVVYRSFPRTRQIDFPSCIRVIKAHADDIEPKIYTHYHCHMLTLAIRQQADKEIIGHYRREATCCKEYLSFVRFLLIRSPESEEQLNALRQEYLEYIAHLEVEL